MSSNIEGCEGEMGTINTCTVKGIYGNAPTGEGRSSSACYSYSLASPPHRHKGLSDSSSSPSSLKLLLFNARSVNNKTNVIQDVNVMPDMRH